MDVEQRVKDLKIGKYCRHIILCGGKSCSGDEGDRAWQYLKKRLLELDSSQSIYRSKATCLRICGEGPIAVVYPEGTWYRRLDESALERVIVEHLIGGKPVEELVFARNPLLNPVD